MDGLSVRMYWDEPQPDFEHLEHEWVHVGAAMGAAQTDGYVCGRYAAAGQVTVDAVEQAVFGGLSATTTGCEHGVELLAELIRWTGAQLHGDASEFALLLPDDGQQLTRRTQALADWAQGYLAGLGEGGYRRRGDFAGAMDDWLTDLVEISKADAAGDGAASAADEADYVTVVDYVRTMVVSMLNALRPAVHAEPVH